MRGSIHRRQSRDGVIEADPAKTVEMARGTARSQARSVFPTITISLDIGGRKVEFPFTMSTSSQTSGTMSYVGVQLSAAAYREGEITLEGEKRRVVLVDYNSNGRFDDASVVAPRSTSADGPVYPQVGEAARPPSSHSVLPTRLRSPPRCGKASRMRP